VDAGLRGPANGRHTNACVRWTSGLAGTAADDMMGIVNGPSPGAPELAGLGLWVNQAEARGRLTLATTDPTVDPDLQLNLAGDDRDLRRLADCVAVAAELLDHPAFRRLRRGPVVGPDGGALPEAGDRKAVTQWVRDTVDVAAHVSATCPIGRPADGGVVDSAGAVHGLASLWVVDLSIAPSAPRANTNLTAIMLAGRLAGKLATDSASLTH